MHFRIMLNTDLSAINQFPAGVGCDAAQSHSYDPFDVAIRSTVGGSIPGLMPGRA
jgi:hypothetical protein